MTTSNSNGGLFQHVFVGNDLKAFEDGIENLPDYISTSNMKAALKRKAIC